MQIKRIIPSEATIQAEVYCALKAAGLRCVLEQVIEIDGETRFLRRAKIRVDVLVLDAHDNAVAAIEVKNQRVSRDKALYSNTRQYRKYTSLGLPFAYCTHLDDIAKTVVWAASLVVVFPR